MSETTSEQLAEIQGQAESTPATEYTPPEGWRVLAVGEVLRDGDERVQTDESRYATRQVGRSVQAHERYIRPIEPQPEPEPESDTELQAQVAFLKGREVTLGTRLQQEREVTTRLRGDLELVQKLLGTEKRRVTQLEELVTSLRTINDAQEKAFTAAGKENTALRNQLAAVASVAADRQRLLSELDAAQQVPQAIADRFEEGWNQGTARAVETVLAWLEPIRAVDNEHLANETLQHLPQIMRHLTGLAQD